MSIDAAILAAQLRPLQRSRVAACRVQRSAPGIDLIELTRRDDGGKRLLVRGLMTCASVHSCPCCAEKILTARAQEISEAVKVHGHGRTALLTVTLRHRPAHELYIQRRILTDAFSRMFAGKGGQRFRRRIGYVGTIRGAEQTHGAKGWHPHLHALLLLTAPPKDTDDDGRPEQLRKRFTVRWRNAVRATWRYLRATTIRALGCGVDGEHWDGGDCNCDACGVKLYDVARKTFGARYFAGPTGKEGPRTSEAIREAARRFAGDFGSMPKLKEILPDDEHGADVRMGASARYIAKLGLEVSSVTKTQKGKDEDHQGRTSWQVARDAAKGDRQSQGLWRQHSRAMFGARQITWSRGLKARLALPEIADRDLSREDGPSLDAVPCFEQLIGCVSGKTWDASAKPNGQLTFASLFQHYEEGAIWSHALVTRLISKRRLRIPVRQAMHTDPADRVVNVRISDADRADRRTRDRDGPIRLWWENWVPVRGASLRGVPNGSTLEIDADALEEARRVLLAEGAYRKTLLEELERLRRRETTIRRASAKRWSGGTREERAEQIEELRHHIRFDLCGM